MNVHRLHGTAEADHDVILVGAGLVGAALALALAPLSLRIALVEAQPLERMEQPGYDERSTALSYASVRILESLGLWGMLADHASPIRHIHVSQQGSFGISRFDAHEVGVEALGQVIPNHRLIEVLLDRLPQQPGLTLHLPARVTAVSQDGARMRVRLEGPDGPMDLSSRLLVAADGAESPVRTLLGIGVTRRDYGQSAIIANVTPELPHGGRAFERFTPEGPLALLPLGERCALVWTVPSHAQEWALELPEGHFLDELEARFGRRLGRFQRVGHRQAYPLSLVRARRMVEGRAVLLGNAAHAIHPVAGLGFNLALRETAILAEVLGQGHDPGDRDMLEHFEQRVQPYQDRLIAFSDRLPRLFGQRFPGFKHARSLGLLGLDLLPGAKTGFVLHAMGLDGAMPALARQTGLGARRGADQ
jgi:2-octaprenyl-6-methoxyphenol hydroxylase